MAFKFATHEPLTPFRAKASFNWKNMKLYIEDEETLAIKEKIFQDLILHNVLNSIHPDKEKADDLKRHTYNLSAYCSLNYDKFIKPFETNLAKTLPSLFFVFCLNHAVSYKVGLSRLVSVTILKSIGTSTEKAIENISSGKWHSCISLTEIGHGSNLMNLQTTATYDAKTKTFVLHSPTIEAWKCWSGNLGKGATHALVLAQLYTPDGQCHGIHWFFTPVRDPNTLKPYPGVIVGDMGEKIGINGLDNGFMAFTNYHIPKKTLLNGISDVTLDGQFVTKVPNHVKRFALTASNLNASRTCILGLTCFGMHTQSIIIAIRYAFAAGKSETSINCPHQQLRLFPHLSSAYVLGIVVKSFLENLWNYQSKVFTDGIDDEKLYVEAADTHVIVTGLKAITTSAAAKCIQEAIEYCGGHAYLEAAGLGTLRNDIDANVTLEGDNNILLQQISKTLLKLSQNKQKAKEQSNLGLYDFIEEMDATLDRKCDNNRLEMTPEVIKSAYNWLLCYLLNECSMKMASNMTNGANSFDAFNKIQVYDCNVLSNAFMENFIITRYFEWLNQNKPPEDCQSPLINLGLLYSFCCLEKHMLALCKEQYFSWDAVDIVQNYILNLCDRLKDDAVSLADVLAPPDEMLNSILGKSDGEINKRVVASYMNNLQRPK
uniref:Acyl-coenzyme A oxidase n=1 Tax=Strigamia maritima TaxID=126957 RepID=T1IV85_STRMM